MAGNGNLATDRPLRRSQPARDTREVLQLRLRRSEMLLQLTQRVAAIEDLDALLVMLVEIVANETNAERGTLFLNDADHLIRHAREANLPTDRVQSCEEMRGHFNTNHHDTRSGGHFLWSKGAPGRDVEFLDREVGRFRGHRLHVAWAIVRRVGLHERLARDRRL